MKCVEVYKELYHQEPFDVAFCPYRISPLGAHIDHQYGKINGLAIDKGIHMAYHPKQNGVVELQSLNFPKRAQFFVSAVPDEKQGDWADHLRGAAKMLGEKYRLKVGLSGIIEGSLPIGGLSSSASVIICFLSALCKVNGIQLEPMEMILTAKAAENQYVGVDTTDIDEFVVISNHKFAQHFGDWKSNKQKTRPYEITVIDDGTSTNETRLGAVKDIQLAVEKLNLADDLLVMAGDNVLDFSLSKFVDFAKEKNTSCVMCHEENELKKQQKTAIITLDGNDLITSYEEKPKEPKGNLAVPPFYCYRACDVKRIQEALNNGCGYDAPGSFAAWLSKQTPMHAYIMPGKRYDIGDINSYEYVKSVFSK